MSTDLAALTGAAERWDGMAAEFAKQETAYRRDVHGIAAAPSWSGMSAEAAHGRFGVTLTELQYAQTEARAIASLLRDAHARFTELKGRLTAVRGEARAAGMRVSDRGLVSADPEHAKEPDEATVRSWQDRIDAAVRAVTDADAGVETALAAVVVDADPSAGGRGFNGRALGDVEKYEALAAEDALGRLGRGGHLSRHDLAELERTFRDNSGDEAFSRTLLDDLGAAGTITLTNELNDLVHVRGGASAGTYATIESGLANTLATATRDTHSPWYRHWRAAVRRAGVRHYATDAQGERLDKAVGYQSLVTLMSRGHGYAPRMLEDLTDDMIAAERREPGIWRLKDTYSGGHGGWFANDPVDGALALMSRDPHTAADYLGSDARMRYLVEERDWKVVLHEHAGAKTGTYAAGPDGDDRAGFGAALQAAATGIDPADRHAHYVPHTGPNEAVFRSALKHLSNQGDDFPPSLRRPMANVLVNHGATVHAAMSEIDIGHSPLKQDQLFEVTKQVSKDQHAYGTLNGGLNQAMVANLHADRSDSAESLRRAGRTVGFLEEARIQAQSDPKTAEFEAKPIFDKAISYIPVAGEDVQAGFDYVTGKWLEDEQKRLDAKQTQDNFQAYSDRNQQLMALSREWSRSHQTGEDPHFDPQTEINRSAGDGIDHASGISGAVAK
ncbi:MULTISPECIES: hypothetical protein [Streptomyces]|uniref:hypothetical protein n=1 Tax=Streptomyces TaxID=1883 RepID=UPI0029B9E6AF|nr:hypothetical protein [Streptomyces sp. WI03-4A]MDX2597982.1 hypothetical protein [Streptomyces sp. WI03-4A]